MNRSFRALPTVVVAVVLVSSMACNKTSTTVPTATQMTDTKTGTVQPGGADSQTFTVIPIGLSDLGTVVRS